MITTVHRYNYKIIFVLAVTCTFISNAGVHAQAVAKTTVDVKAQLLNDPLKIPALLKQGKIKLQDIPNPHWEKNACKACHKGKASGKNKKLRHKDMDKLCNSCHSSVSPHSYIHVSDIKLPKSMQKRLPKSFRQAVQRGGNKLTCITCHDLPMTCKKIPSREKGRNPMFFRGGPYKSRTGICYHCHDEKKYQHVNAHDQISEQGKLLKDKCYICHKTDKGLDQADGITRVDFNLKDDLSRLCWGCHRWEPHPGGSFTFFSGKGGTPNHLVKPSEQIMARMAEMQDKNNVRFPLEPGSGKVFCATCHNPHERGVIKAKALAAGADSDKRLRMQKICINCHDK